MQHHYTFSLFFWLLGNWNWATVLVLAVIIAAVTGRAAS